MSALSWSRTGSVEALKRRFLSFEVASRCLHNPPLASREERSCRLVWSKGSSHRGPFAPRPRSGFRSPTSGIVKPINDGMTAGLMDGTLVDISSWLACVTGGLTASTYPVLHKNKKLGSPCTEVSVKGTNS